MSLKKQALSGVIWTFVEMFGGQFINFFVNIILARKLTPDNYGVIGMIYIFVIISNTLMDTGLSPSLMRTKKLNSIDYSTTFVSQLIFSVVLYFILFFSAPLIAEFYQNEDLIKIIRVFCLIIIIQGSVQVQSVYLLKNLNFRKQTLIKLPSIILSSIVAIYLAYNGYGVWSLIWMYLLQNFFWALFHWIFGDWKFSVKFNRSVFYRHFDYGYKISIVDILNNITTNIYQIVLGRNYSLSTVGYYTQSLTLYQVPFSNVFYAILKVLLPIFAEIQDDLKKVKDNFIKCQEVLIILMYPIFIFLLFNAEEILIVLFSEKWRNASIYLQVLCSAAFFNVVTNWDILILKILKDSRKILKYEVIVKLFLFFVIFIAVIFFKDIHYLLITIPLVAIVSMLYFTTKVCRMLKIKYWKFLFNTLYFFLICLVPAIIVNYVSFENLIIELLSKITLYAFIYLIIIAICKKNMILELKELVSKRKTVI